MSLFQEYETKRKSFNVGKRWICRNPTSVGFSSRSKGEIIEIIENKEGHVVRYRVLNGTYARDRYNSNKSSIIKGYEPYDGPI